MKPTRTPAASSPVPVKWAHVVGLLVTAIVVLGTHATVTTAMSLGIVAGALATFCVSLSEQKRAAKRT